MRSKKAVPAKNSEANFWRPRFTWPLRAGKRANANFACSEGFFCAWRAALSAGAGCSCAACRSCGGFCARCSGIFLPVCRCLVPGLRAACCFCAWSGLCCRGLLAVCPPCALCVQGFCCRCLACLACCAGGAGRCRRPAAVREVSRRCARIPWRCFLACVFCRFCVWLGPACVAAACCLPAVRFVCAFSSCFGCLFARSVLCARVFSLIFHLFLPDFCLSNLFSLVAQAATGLYFLPKRK